MQVTPWMEMSSLYEWSCSAEPSEVWIRARADMAGILGQAGVYLIADTTLASTWMGEQLIYVGVAGGRGARSNFHARLHKHALKAMNATADTVERSSITDTRRWQEYRARHIERHGDLSSVLDAWKVRLLVLPNTTEAERSVIMLMEQVVALAFDRNRLSAGQPLILPRCNDQSLAHVLVAMLDIAERPPERPLPVGDIAIVGGAPPDIPLAFEQWDDMALDDEFVLRMGGDASLQALYRQILAQIEDVCASAAGQAVELNAHYRQHGATRDLRVAWRPQKQRKNIMRIVPSGAHFSVWAHASPEALTALGIEAVPSQDPLRARFQVGGAAGPVAWIGTALRLAIANRGPE